MPSLLDSETFLVLFDEAIGSKSWFPDNFAVSCRWEHLLLVFLFKFRDVPHALHQTEKAPAIWGWSLSVLQSIMQIKYKIDTFISLEGEHLTFDQSVIQVGWRQLKEEEAHLSQRRSRAELILPCHKWTNGQLLCTVAFSWIHATTMLPSTIKNSGLTMGSAVRDPDQSTVSDNRTLWVHSLTKDLEPIHKLSRCASLTFVDSSARGCCVLSGPPVMLLLAWGWKTEKTTACKFCKWAPPNLWTYLWCISTGTHLVCNLLCCIEFFFFNVGYLFRC